MDKNKYYLVLLFTLIISISLIYSQDIIEDSINVESEFQIIRPENIEIKSESINNLDSTSLVIDTVESQSILENSSKIETRTENLDIVDMNIDIDKNIKGSTNLKSKSYYSLLLPGLGEYKLGKKEQAKIFFISEASILLGLMSSTLLKYKYFDDARGYLYKYGHCSSAWDIPEDSMSILINYDSSAFYYRFDESIRNRDPNPEEYYSWEWDSEDNRMEFFGIWSNAQEARVVSYFFAGATVLNRVLSFLNARRIASNISEGKQYSLNSKFIPILITQNTPGILWLKNF